MRKIKRKSDYYVYIVRCQQGTLYTGYTSDLKARIKRHNSGHGAKYLRGKGPVKLVWFKKYRYWKCAVKEEARIKRLPRQRKMQLIKPSSR
jgi:putative endonuclease